MQSVRKSERGSFIMVCVANAIIWGGLFFLLVRLIWRVLNLRMAYFGHYRGERWPFLRPGVLILLRHERLRYGRPWILAAQQGHRGRVLTSATINRRRMVATEFGM